MTFAKIVAFLAHLSRADGPYPAPVSLNLYGKSASAIIILPIINYQYIGAFHSKEKMHIYRLKFDFLIDELLNWR